jgi:hypothetical protein
LFSGDICPFLTGFASLKLENGPEPRENESLSPENGLLSLEYESLSLEYESKSLVYDVESLVNVTQSREYSTATAVNGIAKHPTLIKYVFILNMSLPINTDQG